MTTPDNTPAFPLLELNLVHGSIVDQHFGMTLRDYFAIQAPTNEVQELNYQHMSRLAQERLTGMKYPEKPEYKPNDSANVDFQIAELEFKCAVDAAIRFKLADAMMEARK